MDNNRREIDEDRVAKCGMNDDVITKKGGCTQQKRRPEKNTKREKSKEKIMGLIIFWPGEKKILFSKIK